MINTVADLEQQIRDFINNPRKQYALLQNRAAWNMLCSCLDLIGDTELAISAYDRTPHSGGEGGGYLLIYGILQTLFLQQDAVRNLCSALKIGYVPDAMLEQIREIRNDSVGHPTKRGGGQGNAFNFISRVSLSKSGFDLITTYANGKAPLFRHIDVPSLIKNQQQILFQALAEVIQKLKKEEAEHRAMFKSDRLQDSFPAVLGYYFEKLFEAVHGGMPTEWGSLHIKLISEAIETFKTKLEKRGILKAYDSLTYRLDLLEYPIMQLSLYFAEPKSSSLNNKSAYIFAFFVEKHIDELKKIAEEIDEEYEAET